MNYRAKVPHLAAALLVFVSALFAQQPAGPAQDDFKYLPPTRDTYLKFENQVEGMLQEDVLNVWFPRSIDNQNGGFYSVFRGSGNRDRARASFRFSRDA